MHRQFNSITDLIEFLRGRKIGEATLTASVATTTSPGGEQIAFRGRVVVGAGYGKRSLAEYVEQVMPYVTSTRSPDLPASAEHAAGLRGAQLELARQLRSYRGEYQAVVAAAKDDLTRKLQQAGIAVVEAEV